MRIDLTKVPVLVVVVGCTIARQIDQIEGSRVSDDRGLGKGEKVVWMIGWMQ